MKFTLRFFLVIGSVLLLAYCAAAQVTRQQNADTLRETIRRVEAMDVSRSSVSVQSSHKRALLSLYIQLSNALKKDIADLRALDEAVGGADQENQKEITRLSAELNRVARRVQVLENEVGAGAQAPGPLPQTEDQNTAASNVRPDALVASITRPVVANDTQTAAIPVADALSAKEPQPAGASSLNQTNNDADKMIEVSGTATVINEHFFKNPDQFTPEQIKQAVLNKSRSGQGAQTPGAPSIQTATEYRGKKGDGKRVLVVKDEFEQKVEAPIPLNNAKVVITKNSDKSEVGYAYTNPDGTYSILIPAAVGNYTVTVKVENFSSQKSFTVNAEQKNAAKTSIKDQDLQLLVRPLGEYSRAIVGFEQAGASSAKSTQKYFFDLTLSTPFFRGDIHPYFGRRGRFWGTARVTSVPQQINSPVGTFAAQFVQQASNVKVNEVAQAIEFLAGAEYRLTNKMFTFGSFDGKTANKFTLSIVGGAGAITPINPRDTLEIFKVFPGAPGLPDIPAGKEFVAFVSADRDRFFHQYYIGFRMQGYYFDYRNPDVPLQRYPATLDLTYGQNESVTGGRLRGGVIRLEGFYPLPYEDLKFINLFGTALIRPKRTKITDPLILEPAPAGTTVPASNVFLLTVPQIDRDYYRVGVGIDFIQVVKKLGAGGATTK